MTLIVRGGVDDDVAHVVPSRVVIVCWFTCVRVISPDGPCLSALLVNPRLKKHPVVMTLSGCRTSSKGRPESDMGRYWADVQSRLGSEIVHLPGGANSKRL